jgi:cobyric acid synthase
LEEENVIKQWILVSDRKGFSRLQEHVLGAVFDFVNGTERHHVFKNGAPTRGWYNKFLNRHPDIVHRTSEAVTSSSSKVSKMICDLGFAKSKNILWKRI